ncbi:hypothetical protein Xazr_09400 [Xanthomonas campestris pv. azadirachtae]|nr:hypothetical protein Xazr_09400 [Xanthomonas campestris pv. azadirachtae]
MSQRAKPISTPAIRTAKQARQWLIANGISISEFARTHAVNRDVVSDLLRGRSRGNYGESHRAAVALGLKSPPDSATQILKASGK